MPCRPWGLSDAETLDAAQRAAVARANFVFAHDALGALEHLSTLASSCTHLSPQDRRRPSLRAAAAALVKASKPPPVATGDAGNEAGTGFGGGVDGGGATIERDASLSNLSVPNRPPWQTDREREPLEFALEVAAAAHSAANRAVGAADDAAGRAEKYADKLERFQNDGGTRGLPLAARQPELAEAVAAAATHAAAADEASRAAAAERDAVRAAVQQGQHESAVDLAAEVRLTHEGS